MYTLKSTVDVKGKRHWFVAKPMCETLEVLKNGGLGKISEMLY